jgi:succinate-acetate transporter protein
MMQKIELTSGHREVFAEPTPMGLIGLAIGCAALLPVALGLSLTPAALKTAAMFCLLFGGGCQLFAGIMNLVNKNLLGGTLFLTFAFNWGMNWWSLDSIANGVIPDANVLFAVDATFLVIFVVLTYGFGFYSKLLFFFLLDIDLLEVAKLVKHFAASGSALFNACNLAVAAFTLGLLLIALYIAFAMLMNPTVGKPLFKVAGPMFKAAPKPAFDFSLRQLLFDLLYKNWREHAFAAMPLDEIKQLTQAKVGGRNILPDLFYLQEIGALSLAANGNPTEPKAARLTAAGIDLYEQLVLKKYEQGGMTP